MSERDTHMKRQWERVSMRISVIVYMGFFFVRLNQTERVHTSVYVSALYMQMYTSVRWCMQMCVSSCETASQYRGGVSSDRAYVVQRAEYHRDTCHSTLLCRDYDPDKSTSTIVSILSWLQASDRALPHPRHPALTFLRAASPREIAADELLEMLKTAKLGSVTGNLQGRVLAGISDRTLSTRGGLTLISTALSPSVEQPRLEPRRGVGGSENPYRFVICGLLKKDWQAMWWALISGILRFPGLEVKDCRNENKHTQ